MAEPSYNEGLRHIARNNPAGFRNMRRTILYSISQTSAPQSNKKKHQMSTPWTNKNAPVQRGLFKWSATLHSASSFRVNATFYSFDIDFTVSLCTKMTDGQEVSVV